MPIDHVSVGSNDVVRARAFYLAALTPLGLRIVAEDAGRYCDFGIDGVAFSIETPVNGERASPGNGAHVCFKAADRARVEAFHAAALAAGGRDSGAPGPRPNYGEHYFGAFVLDPDGNKIEACCHAPPG
jgi:catechol 2,3-dioxygenase-like lactoylglutathione lyase family enzyme